MKLKHNYNQDVTVERFFPGTLDAILRVACKEQGVTLPVVLDTSAKCPGWMRFLNETFPRRRWDAQKLKQFFGAAMVPKPLGKRLLVLFGPAASGKSVTVSVMVHLVGRENKDQLQMDIHDGVYLNGSSYPRVWMAVNNLADARFLTVATTNSLSNQVAHHGVYHEVIVHDRVDPRYIDPTLTTRLKDELPGIYLWALRGLHDLVDGDYSKIHNPKG